MLREEMQSYEEMKKRYPDLRDEEKICYRIEKGIESFKKRGIRLGYDTVDHLLDDVMWDLFEAEAVESTIMEGRLTVYCSMETRKEYEVIYDCDSFLPMKINSWEMVEDDGDDYMEDDDDL
ncbi:MAG: hypothetical protein ACI4S4_00035 [Candidatus Ornithospirochaeta sp.]